MDAQIFVHSRVLELLVCRTLTLGQLADHDEQALLQMLSAHRILQVSHVVLRGRYVSCVTANGRGGFCISVEIQPHDKNI